MYGAWHFPYYEIEYRILKNKCATGRIDTLLFRDSLFATMRPADSGIEWGTKLKET
jgi:hypothetical protein